MSGSLFTASKYFKEVIRSVVIRVVCSVIYSVCKIAPDKSVVEVESILVLALGSFI